MVKIFNVYSLRLMNYLEEKGFKLLGTKVCEEDNKKIIFKYEDTEELRNVVKEYTNSWVNKFNEGK